MTFYIPIGEGVGLAMAQIADSVNCGIPADYMMFILA
jgi:hypothetical protein